MSSRLPRRVRTFIREHVHSVGELELMMMLRADSDRCWRPEELCEVLRCPPTWAAAQLDAMAAAGLVQRGEEGWRFAPASAELEELTAELEQAYRTQTRDLVRFIFATPGSELKAFSDAFRVRREKER